MWEAVVEKRAEDAARSLADRDDVEQVQEKLDEKAERAHRIVRHALDRRDDRRETGGEEE